MAQDNYSECFDILVNNFGSTPQATTKEFVEEQQNYFAQIYEIYLNKTKANLLEWCNKNPTARYLTFKDWYNDPTVQKDLKRENKAIAAKFAKSAPTKTEQAHITEYDSLRKADGGSKYYLWDLIKKPLQPEGILLDTELLKRLKQQLPEHSDVFSENLISYLASDAEVPLVVSSSNKYKNLWGILVQLTQRLRGYTYDLVISPSDVDYYMAPDGLWEPFPESILTKNRKDFIEFETRIRNDKVGFFSINAGDESSLNNDREFRSLFKFFTRNYKTVVLLDSWVSVPKYHWLERELKEALTLDYGL